MEILFYVLIVITGSLTIFSDLKYKRIRNQHLLPIIIISLAIYAVFIISGRLELSLSLVYNIIAAIAIGFGLYFSRLWEAGDAKLFITYCLLLATSKPIPILPLPALVLFFITFLLSFILILPTSIYGIIINRRIVFKELLSIHTLYFFANIFMIVLGLSWIIQPVIHAIPFKNNIFLIFIVTLCGYRFIFRIFSKIKKPLILIPVFILGLTLRVFINPEFFDLKNIVLYLSQTFVFAIIFYLINFVISAQIRRPVRIPFSPFMFIGALLTNSNVIWEIMRFMYYRF